MYSLRLGAHPVVVLHGYQALKEALCGQAVNFEGRGKFPIMDNALRGYGMSPTRAWASPLPSGPQICLMLWFTALPGVGVLGVWQVPQLLHHSSAQPMPPTYPSPFFIPLHLLFQNMWLFEGVGAVGR